MDGIKTDTFSGVNLVLNYCLKEEGRLNFPVQIPIVMVIVL